MKYDCHICVDLVTAMAVIAYPYKYAYKRQTQYVLEFCTVNMRLRHTGASDTYRVQRPCGIFSDSPRKNEHLQLTCFTPTLRENSPLLPTRQMSPTRAMSGLMRYFGRPISPFCDDLTYPQYFEPFSVERKEKRRRIAISNDSDDDDIYHGEEQPPSSTATLRDRYGNFVYRKTTANASRIQHMSPEGDIWFLRLLLLHRPSDSFV